MHQDFLRRLLPFKASVPSHDTLNDIINAIDGTLFAQCFTAWVEGLREPAPATAAGIPEVVAIDGKTSWRTHDRSKDRGPLHMVSAWAKLVKVPLAQRVEYQRRAAANAWCSANKLARPSPTRSPPSRSCSNASL